MTVGQSLLLVLGGLVAGIVNTLAGAGSLLSVPLLVLIGLPATVANGTNRVGVLLQCIVAAARFRAEGFSGIRRALPLLLPVVLGSFVGSLVISQVSDKLFQRLFAIVMVILLAVILWRPGRSNGASNRPRWSRRTVFLVFLGIGFYGGLFQAGVGIALVFALAATGEGLVDANSIKVVINAVLTGVAIPVFLSQGQIAWEPALLLGTGFAVGGELGARLAVTGGERVIRPALTLSVLALAGRMLGLY